MKFQLNKFNYLLAALLVIYLILIPTLTEKKIQFEESTFKENKVSNQQLTDGIFRVGQEIDVGIYDVQFLEETTVNEKRYQKGLKIKNLILNKGIYLEIFGHVNLVQAKGMNCQNLNFNGICIVDKTKDYQLTGIKSETPSEEFSIDIKINGEVYELDTTNPTQTIKLNKGDVLEIRQWINGKRMQNKLKVEEKNEK